MVQKSLEVTLASTSSVVQVTAALGSAGQNPGFAEKTVYVQISNGRIGGPVEYRIDSGDWIFLDEESGKQLEIDLSISTLLLRKASPIDSSVPVTIERMSMAGLILDGRYRAELGGSPVTVVGVSGLNEIVTAALAAGWAVTGWQWHRVVSGVDSNIAGATSAAYTQQAADVVPGVRIYPAPLGLAYTPLGITAKMKAPGAPPIGTATAGNGTVTINFSAPADNGGSPILDYRVELNDGSTMTVTGSPAVFPNKTNGNPYRGRVSARNAIDYGPQSAQSNQATPVAQVVAPTFTSQPTAQSVTEPGVATFSVSINDGGATTTQKWQKSTNGGTSWADIAGAIGLTYTTAATSTADNNAQFRVAATNSAGTVNSNPATLTVTAQAGVAPSITTQPAAQTVNAPATATFTMAASGATSYKWQKSTDGGTNWTDISGATAASYTTAATSTSDNNTRFRGQAINANGTTTTNAVVLTVNAAVVDTRPSVFIAPSTALTTGTQGYLDGATKFGTAGQKTGNFSVTTTTGNYGWVSVAKSAGVPVFTDLSNNFQGAWGAMGDFTPADGVPRTLYRQDFPNSSPTVSNWSIA